MSLSTRLRLLCLFCLALAVALPLSMPVVPRVQAARPTGISAAPLTSMLPAVTAQAGDPTRAVCFPYDRIYPLALEGRHLESVAPGTDVVFQNSATAGMWGFLQWTVVSTTTELQAFWTGDGNLEEGFAEAAYQSSSGPITQVNGLLERGDWMSGKAGSVYSLTPMFDLLVDTETILRLPIYQERHLGQSAYDYELFKLGRFQLKTFSLSQGGQVWYNGTVYEAPMIALTYLGDEGAPCPTALVDQLLDAETGLPLARLSGTLSVYSDTLPFDQASLIEQVPFTTDASGVYTATLSAPISGSVRLQYTGIEGYFDQYADAALEPEQASPVALRPNLNRRDTRLLASTTLAATLLDALSGAPISNTVGALSVFSGTQLLASEAVTTDAQGAYTVTFALPISQSVTLQHAMAGYPAQYVEHSFTQGGATPLALHSGRSALVTRLSRHTFLPLVRAEKS